MALLLRRRCPEKLDNRAHGDCRACDRAPRIYIVFYCIGFHKVATVASVSVAGLVEKDLQSISKTLSLVLGTVASLSPQSFSTLLGFEYFFLEIGSTVATIWKLGLK